MSEAAITHNSTDGGGRYALAVDGAEAELTYRTRDASVIVANHTGVPDAMRGTGAGLKLLKRMVEDARASDIKIVPRCPFIEAMRKRHPEWADVFTV